MLSAVGLKVDGSKIDLANRLVKAAKIDDADSLAAADIATMTDLQVAYALQQLGASLLPTPRERRAQLHAALDEELPDSPANAVVVDDPVLDRQDLLRQIQMKDDEIRRLMTPTVGFGSASVIPDQAAPNLPNPLDASGSSISSLQLMASSIASAITDGLASANESTSGVAASAKIDRTHPAHIDPRNHGNDPHKFGLLIKRMIEVDYASAGLAGIAWRHAFKAKSLQIQTLVHAEAQHSDFIEGESDFISLVNQCVSLSMEHDKDAAKYATLRSRQLAWWFDAYNTIKQDLRNSTRFWSSRALTFRMQMEDLICTALGLGFTNTQLRNMRASLKLRSGFTNGNSDDEGSSNDASRPGTSSSLKRAYSDLGPPTDRDSRKPKVPGTIPDSNLQKITGQRMPIAKSIVGASTPGALDCDSTCEACGIGGTPETGHRKFECPKLFGQEHPGKSMPGFTRSGNRVTSLWDGANITATLRAQWLKLHSLGFFTRPPFRKNPDQVPVMRG